MTQKEKELLLKDLCARLPYGAICSIYRIDDLGVGWRDEKLSGYFYNGTSYEFYFGETPISIDNDISKIKPYLRSISSMTEEEEIEYNRVLTPLRGFMFEQEELFNPIQLYKNIPFELYEFFNSHHFDYRGLIPKGLAIEVTEENNPYKD